MEPDPKPETEPGGLRKRTPEEPGRNPEGTRKRTGADTGADARGCPGLLAGSRPPGTTREDRCRAGGVATVESEIWATEVGALCRRRGWTQQRLVHELRRVARSRNVALPTDESLERMFRMWRRGDRGPSQFYASLLGAVFGVPFAEGKPGGAGDGGDAAPSAHAVPAPYDGHGGLGSAAGVDPGHDPGLLWGPGGMPAALEEMVTAMERRRFLELTGGTLASAAHQWMVADPARVAAVLAGRRVDHAAVDDLDRVVDVRRRQDDVLGGKAIYDVAVADLRLTVDILRHCSYTEPVGQRLYAVAAEQARLAGWAAFDAGNPGLAQRFWLAGLRASHEAADPALGVGANILRCMAQQSTAGDPRGAVTLLRSARAHAGPALTPIEKAVLAGALAYAHAGAGEVGNADAEIDEAFTQVGRARPDENPAYMYCWTPAAISWWAGRALVAGGAPGRAIPHLDSAAAATNRAAHPRDWVFHQLDLASAHARDGNPEHAVHLGHEAVDLASTVASDRVGRAFAELVREIEATGHPAADLREHAASLLEPPA